MKKKRLKFKTRNMKDNNKNTHDMPEKAEMDDVEVIDDIPEAADETQDNPMTEENDLEAKVNELQAALDKEKKEYLFLMAEFDNFRKRNLKERGELIKNAAESAMKGLLPIVDDFERGLEAARKSDDAAAIREGMELIYNKLIKYLAQNGVKPIESTGTVFDPELHEAIAMVPVEDESMKGKVIDTPTKGYTINDKVLRHAKVAVGQ